jgi:uncharacterized protein YbaR (Trm112 family)
VGEGRSLLRERSLHSPEPPETGLVLDVGGGDRPHPRADVVVDKYVVDDFEREMGLAFTRPVVVADGEELPFADGSFYYLIASHVLEHAIDPNRMAAEFSRVAAAGFVQLPTAYAERHYGWPFHPWLVDREGDTLVFNPKTEHGGYENGMHDAYDESLFLRLGWAAHRSRWHHSVHWSGQLPVRAPELEAREHQQADIDLERTLSTLNAMARGGKVVPLDARLKELLRCPDAGCRGTLTFGDDAITCDSCGARYPAPGGVPVLLMQAR